MQIGFVGLGKMGLNMSRRLIKGGHKIVGYNRSPDETELLIKARGKGVYSLEELVQELKAPRIIWLMIPAGAPTDDTIKKLTPLLKKGDTIILVAFGAGLTWGATIIEL